MAHVTFEQILQILWSFCLGLADSLRGAVDLFLLDSAAVRHKEKKMVQRDLKKEVLLNRDSPARDIVGMENFAKKRALERRERAASTSSTRYAPCEKLARRTSPRSYRFLVPMFKIAGPATLIGVVPTMQPLLNIACFLQFHFSAEVDVTELRAPQRARVREHPRATRSRGSWSARSSAAC